MSKNRKDCKFTMSEFATKFSKTIYNASLSAGKLFAKTVQWLRRNLRPEGKMDGWILKFFNPKSILTGNRFMLVGDASGLINPLSGDGIQYALLSARWAAETLEDCCKKNDFSAAALFNYRKKVDKELGYDFALSNLLVQFARNKTLTPVWMKILSVMISRAKEDKQYADTIAGIFEGT
ncbi:MAG: hypothetical protein M3139_18320, partial [Bacteroidota bacterium]|nr:hypothetical protein [Bacteroidota bacterium]